jgi:hypothetical protein
MGGKSKHLEKKACASQLYPLQLHLDWTGIEPRSPKWEASECDNLRFSEQILKNSDSGKFVRILQFWFKLGKLMDARWKPSFAFCTYLEFTKYFTEWSVSNKNCAEKSTRCVSDMVCAQVLQVSRMPPELLHGVLFPNLYIHQFTVFHWTHRG